MGTNPSRFAIDLTGKTLLGRYEIVRELDRGGMGIVYEGRNLELGGQPVVVKVPSPDVLVQEGFRKDFAREIDGLLALQHAHVVPILSRGEDDEIPFMVLRFLGGGNLKRRLGGRRQAAAEVLAWLVPVARTLDWIHGKGYVHRDVKPANILFDEAGEPFVSDFGIAKALSKEGTATPKGFVAGSSEYMAPEQAAANQATPKVDQYALACVVYEALSGRKPFPKQDADSDLLVLLAKQKAPPPDLATLDGGVVPAAASAAVMRALSIDPAARFASCGEFAAAFAKGLVAAAPPVDPEAKTQRRAPALESVPVSEGSVGRRVSRPDSARESEAPSRPPRRSRVPWIVGGLVAAAGAAFLLWNPPGRSAPGDAGARGGPAGASVATRVTLDPLGLYTTSRAVRATGSVVGPAPRRLLVGGVEAVVERGRFDVRVTAPEEGPFHLTIAPAKGDVVFEPVEGMVVVDTVPPVIEVTAPPATPAPIAVSVRVPEPRLAGRIVDANPGPLLLNGKPAATAADGTFDLPITLAEAGDTVLVLTTKDAAGNASAAVRRTIRYVPPPAAVEAWRAPLAAAEGHVAARRWAEATASYAAAKTARLPAGQATQALVDGVAAYEGLKRLEALAAANDWDGVEKGVALWRGVDGLALPVAITNGVGDPKITIESPPEGAEIEGEKTTVRGTVFGRPTDRIRVFGKTFDLKNGRFDLELSWGSSPEPTLVFEVVDPAGTVRGKPFVRTMKLPSRGATNTTVAAFLGGFAVAVGSELDAATGYPRRIRRLKDDGEMVLIPGGTFQMGTVSDDPVDFLDDEKPRHAVTLSKAYYLDVNEVTVGQWKRYVAGGGGRSISNLWNEATDTHPIHYVDHTEATAYARWAGAALPTEAQFERALRGGVDDRVYPFGNTLPPRSKVGNVTDESAKRQLLIVWFVKGYDDGFVWHAPARSFPPNEYGVYDLLGNVEEWCADWYGESYYGSSPPRDPTGPGSGSSRVVRGSSAGDIDGYKLRASRRSRLDPSYAGRDVGFRLSRSLD